MDNSVTFDPSLNYGATFRFPVTWSYLSGAPNPGVAPNPASTAAPQAIPKTARPIPMPVPAPKPVEPVAATMEIATTKPTEVPRPAEPRASGPDAKWEMVIPKMARPAAVARPQRALERTAPPPPASPTAETETAPETPTEISFYAGSEASFIPRRWKVLSFCAAVVVVGRVLALVRPGGSSSVSDGAPAAVGTWSRRTAYVVGGKDPREILIYS